jgi:dienelactone hydrolase
MNDSSSLRRSRRSVARRALLVLLGMLIVSLPGRAQIRLVPETSRGGTPQDAPWEHVPESFRQYLETILPPEWPIPTDLLEWERVRRPQTKSLVLELLGDVPSRPENLQVEILSRESREGYTLERFRFHNGVDMIVPGILLIPDDRAEPAPAVIGAHGHGGSKESILENQGPLLVREGYVVAAIDAYYHGERRGMGPGGENDLARPTGQQESLVKLNLLLGRSLWGMMMRDQQILLDYLQMRPEVDPERIGATGISMGSTTSWWLAAIDERVKAIAAAICFTRYTELIHHGELRAHGLYYFVPGVLKHFDTEAIYALIAPRPMLHVSGDGDAGAPTDGIVVLEDKLTRVYDLYDAADRFRSVVYQDTGHEFLPEMADETVAWFKRWLPVQP